MTTGISKAEQFQNKSPHYHDIVKKCEVKDKRQQARNFNKGHYIVGQTCKTHNNVWCCRCGWEFGWHGGEPHYQVELRSEIFKNKHK